MRITRNLDEFNRFSCNSQVGQEAQLPQR